MIIIESYFGRNLLSLAPFPLRHSAIDDKSECRWHNFLLLAQKVSSDGKIGSVTSPICSMEREYLGFNLQCVPKFVTKVKYPFSQLNVDGS